VASVVEVRFKGNRKEFFRWPEPAADEPRLDLAVIVQVDRGEDLGSVSAVGPTAARKCGGCTGCAIGAGGADAAPPERAVLRLASATEIRVAEDQRVEEHVVRQAVAERAVRHGLSIKVTDAEWQWDRRKLTVYFTSEERVDFRSLVRDLAARYHTRIELRQIGARDEAKRLDGIGRCGRRLCCASWLPELRPVSLTLARDQHLSLNPSQISGGCGRLLCCLRYEHDFYVQARQRFPKEGRLLETAMGTERVIAVDIFREAVTLRAGDGNARVVPLGQLERELETRS